VHQHADDKLEVKVLSREGFAAHAGLRVMGHERQRAWLSVDRGMCRHGIELRHNHWESRPRWVRGKATPTGALKASPSQSPRSLSPAACMDAYRRNAGGPAFVGRQANRCLKVCGRTKHTHECGKSDAVIVVGKSRNKGKIDGN